MLKKLAFFVFLSTLSLAQINGYPTVKPTAFQPYLQPPSPALAGLWLDTNPGIVWMGGNPTTIAVQRVHLTASATNYVYVNLVTNTIQVNTTGFGSTIYPIAIVSTNNTQTTTVQDVRPDVYGAGGGGGGGGANLEVNGVSLFDQTVLNLTDASGIHFTNPSGGIVTAQVQGNITPLSVSVSLPSDTGSVNAYAACPGPPNPTLAKGLQIPFIPSHQNTTASTFALCGGSAVPILKLGSVPLVAGDIVMNAPITLTYDGANWQDPVPMAIGVTSYVGGSATARTGAVAYQATDPGVLGITQVGTGTLPIQKSAQGFLNLGDTVSFNTNYCQFYPDAQTVGIACNDKSNNFWNMQNAPATSSPGSGASVTWGSGGGTSFGINTTDIWATIPAIAVPSTHVAFDITASLGTFNIPLNLAGTGAFQINGSFGTPGQCLLSNGSGVVFGACTSGTVSSVTGTSNQIISTGGSTPVLSLASPLIPPGNVQITQLSDGATALSISAKIPTSPTGILTQWQTSGGSALASVDVTGNAIFPSVTTNGTGAGWTSQAAGTDNAAQCLAFLSNLTLTGICDESPATIAIPWVNVRPNAAPSVFSVLASAASASVSGSLETAQHYVPTTDASSPAYIQAADSTVHTAIAGEILTTDNQGNSHDSGVNISGVSGATCATATITSPVTCGGVDSLSLSGNLANTNIISTTVPAGQYQISVYLNATAACGGSPSGNIFVAKIAYSDSNGAVTKTLIGMGSSASLPSNTSAVVTFWSVSSTSTMNVSGTYATCTSLGGSGTEVVDAHYTLVRLR